MSVTDVLGELETSAKILLAAPNIVSNYDRQLAETVFLNFRKTKSPFALCRHLFENSKVEYVLFQTAALLKESLIREWSLISTEDVDALRNYLLQYVLEKTWIPPYVREQILQVIAIIIKRSSIDGRPEARESILLEVSRLISSGNGATQTIGCSILATMLNEYASTIKSSDVGLTWEVHFQAKKQFETTDLRRIFQFCLQALFELEKCEEITADVLTLLKQFLMITEQVLSWNFIYSNLPKKLIGVFEADQSPSFRPGSLWRDILMDKNAIDLIFKIHWKIRANPELVCHSINCLIQLATLHGVIFSNCEARVQYLSFFLDGLLKSMKSYVNSREALGLANIISKLVLFFPPSILTRLPSQQLQEFLNHLTRISCEYIRLAIQEEIYEDRFYSEAFDRLIEAWVTLFHDIQLFPDSFSKQASAEILNAYVQCHLVPEGTRNQTTDNEDVNEVEEDDRTKFRDQLAVIGVCGRQSLDFSLPLLIRIMENRIDLLEQHLQKIHQQLTSLNDMAVINNLYEDIHWMILIIGHTLSMDQEGEMATIPSEIMNYSIAQQFSIDVGATLKLLMTPPMGISEQSTDHVVRLVACMFRLSNIEVQALKANMVSVLSPEVASDIMWFFKRWSMSYLLPNEEYYGEISPILNAAFGRDSERSYWCLNNLMTKIDCNLLAWNSESKVINETVQLFISLIENRDRASCLTKCENMWQLIHKQIRNSHKMLPSDAKRGLFKGLILAGMLATDNESREQYWRQILQPLKDKFKELLSQENFARIYHEEIVKKDILHLLDCFIGVVQGCEMNNVKFLFSFLHPIIGEFVSLITVYHNYQEIVEQIFHFFCECSKRLLCFLNSSDAKLLYDCCLSMIQTYVKFNTSKQTDSTNSEEDQYEDILLLMELLTNLLSKDFVDFGLDDPAENEACVVSAADITLCGLNYIMPLMNAELLKFPRLCLQYFKMITFICEIYPEKICQLPEPLYKQLIASIHLGLGNFGTNIVTLSLDFLSGIASFLVKTHLKNHTFWSLSPFLKIVLNMVFLQNFDFDLSQSASNTLFVLICLYQEEYQNLVKSLLQEHMGQVYHKRLENAFNALMIGVELADERSNKIKFRDNFEKFVADVRGFLCIK